MVACVRDRQGTGGRVGMRCGGCLDGEQKEVSGASGADEGTGMWAECAGATENRMRPCSEGAAHDDWDKITCESDRDRITSVAARCCSDGRSYCPALPQPQLCMDPEAFDPSAQLEYRCYKTGLVTQDECPAACTYHPWHDGSGKATCECTFYVSDSLTPKEECDTLLPGVSSWLHVCVIGRARAGE